MKTYETTVTFRFRQTDMAGIGYFNEVFNIFHDGYEEWAERVCGNKKDWFRNAEWAVPIKKVEAEYFRPLMAFETYNLKITVSTTGNSSFTLKSTISKDDKPCCEIITTHVFMSKKNFSSILMPPEIAARLKN